MVGIGLLAHPGRIGAAIEVLGELSAGVLSESGDLDATLVLVDSTTPRSGRFAESTVVRERRAARAMAQERGVADRLSFIDGPLAAPVQMGFLDRADIFISPLTIDGQVVAGGLTFAAAEGSTTVSTHGRGRKGPVVRDPELVAQLLADMVAATRNRSTSFDGRRHPVFGDSASVEAVDGTTEVTLRVLRAG